MDGGDRPIECFAFCCGGVGRGGGVVVLVIVIVVVVVVWVVALEEVVLAGVNSGDNSGYSQ